VTIRGWGDAWLEAMSAIRFEMFRGCLIESEDAREEAVQPAALSGSERSAFG
jgi:hypothetical protein